MGRAARRRTRRRRRACDVRRARHASPTAGTRSATAALSAMPHDTATMPSASDARDDVARARRRCRLRTRAPASRSRRAPRARSPPDRRRGARPPPGRSTAGRRRRRPARDLGAVSRQDVCDRRRVRAHAATSTSGTRRGRARSRSRPTVAASCRASRCARQAREHGDADRLRGESRSRRTRRTRRRSRRSRRSGRTRVR